MGEKRDLVNRNVAVAAESYAEELLRREPQIQLQRHATMHEAMQSVLDENSQFFVAEATSTLRRIDDEGITGLRYAGALQEYPFRLSIAVNPRVEGLLALIDASLATITPDEESIIRRRWVGAALDGGIKLGQLVRWTLGLGLLIGLGFLAIYRWNRKLKRDVDRRTRLYVALTGCNSAVARCKDENELFSEVCRIAVELGGIKMAWVGLIDPTTQLLQPIACFGKDADLYLQNLQVSVDANSPMGRGLTGTAVQENRPVWCQDLDADPRSDPWRQHRAGFGWRAACVLPLHRKGVTVAVLTLTAGKDGVFDSAARELITDMAANIDQGLDNFVRAAALRDLTQQLQTIADHAPVALAQVDRDLRYRFVNENFSKMHGLRPADIVGKPVAELLGDTAYDQLRHHIDAVMAGQSVEFERDAPPLPLKIKPAVVHVCLAPERDADGRVIGYLTAIIDITARKEAEDQLRKLSQAVEQASDSIMITDTNAVIEYVNDALLENTGYCRDELIGKTPKVLQSGHTPSDT